MSYEFEANILYIFTDGASRSVFNEKLKRKTGRHGGRGIWFVYYDKKGKLIEEDKSDYVSYNSATNQDMELWACVGGLKEASMIDLSSFSKIKVVTDSLFIYNNWKNAVYGNRNRSGWKTIANDPITHKDKRKELVKYMQVIHAKCHKRVDFDWVKGHKDNEYNNKADNSAVKGAQSKRRVLGTNSEVRKGFFKKSIRYEDGFIPIYGAEVFIHINTSRYLRKNRFKYDYEVVSWDNDYFMNKGWIYYNKSTLSAEFIYLVRMNDDGSHQIEKIISTHTKEEIKQKMIDYGLSTDILYGKLGES